MESAILRFLLFCLGIVLFAGAAMVSDSTDLPEPEAPSANDVRAARTIALGLARSASAEEPVPVVVTIAEMEGAARVLSDGLPRLRVVPAGSENGLVVRAALRLTSQTWLNTAVRFDEQPSQGYPSISARVGAVPVPAFLLEPMFSLAHAAAEWRAKTPFPTTREALVAFASAPDRVEAVIDLPRGLLRGVSKLAPSDDSIDSKLADRLYTQAMRRFDPRVPVDLTDVYAELFRDAPGRGADTHARAAMIAAAMVTVGPRVRRIAGGDANFVPTLPATLKVSLAGRDDLAKHFALSAALAAAADPALGRALGTWKELDDSLAGGSGFSFVDLAADRAGLRLGQASMNPERAWRIGRLFGSSRPELLPLDALGFDEGLSDREFERRYGTIATADYADTVSRIDRALDTLPIMRN